jgi:hypothetical protein
MATALGPADAFVVVDGLHRPAEPFDGVPEWL